MNKKPVLFFKITVLFAAVLVLAILLGIFKYGLLNIKQIDIEGDISCTDQNQIRREAELPEKNFFFVNSLKTENILKKKFICIKSVRILKSFPDKVTLKIENRKAVAVIAELREEASFSAAPSADVKDYYLIDDEGVIFGKGADLAVPQIFVSGLKIFSASNLVKILEKISVLGILINKGFIDGDVLTIDSNPPVSKIILRLDGEIDIQLGSLQLIVDKAKIDSKDLEFIDLRFDKPVVKFAPKKK